MFNDGHYWCRAQRGELRQYLKRNGHPSPPLANEPDCTHSQLIIYYDQQGNEVARVHQYLRPDGTIGLSGRPEPKRLIAGGVIYYQAADH